MLEIYAEDKQPKTLIDSQTDNNRNLAAKKNCLVKIRRYVFMKTFVYYLKTCVSGLKTTFRKHYPNRHANIVSCLFILYNIYWQYGESFLENT